MRNPWRRPRSGGQAGVHVPEALPSESISEESSATTSPSSSHPKRGSLKRFTTLFKEPDGRHDENLKSLKRRVIQVRRQPDTAPIRYQIGFRSRTGWEPIRAIKENQDCLVALAPWGPASRYNLFAALDGHGRHGHHCAIFIAQKVVSFLNRVLVPDSDRQTIANAMHRSIVYAERKLEHPAVTYDFHVSGSTGVFVLVHDATLYCANVGDSRALVGREKTKSLAKPGKELILEKMDTKSKGTATGTPSVYIPVAISIDQKPSRPDEKERLLRMGARVDAWEGVDVGEERVWLPEARTPGLAVSRTFGDLIVKPYGVHCTPEVYTLDLCENDRFLVMASDGVFEFISSEEVVNVVGRWRGRGANAAHFAAQELVKLATERWIDDDSVIDDISCVIVFIDVVSPEVSEPKEPVCMETCVRIVAKRGEVDNFQSSTDLVQSSNSSNEVVTSVSSSSTKRGLDK